MSPDAQWAKLLPKDAYGKPPVIPKAPPDPVRTRPYRGRIPCSQSLPHLAPAKIQTNLPAQWHVARNVEYLMRRPAITLKELPGAEMAPIFSDSTKILAAVCRAFDFKPSDIISPRRRIDIVRARFALCMILSDLTTMSLPAIGRFTQRDHSTVMHGIKRARAMMNQEMEFNRRVSMALRELCR